MLGIKLSHRISNQVVRKTTKMIDIVERVKALKWNWAGHLSRMTNDRWTKKIVEWIPRDGTRSRGRQRRRWADLFIQKLGPHWMTKARDRKYWKEMGEAYAKEATTINEIG